MAYVSGSPVYAVADGQPVVYASLDGQEAWRKPIPSNALPDDALIYDLTQGSGNIVSRSGSFPFLRGAEMTWRTSPVGVNANGRGAANAVQAGNGSIIANSFIYSAVVRFVASDYTKVLLSSDQGERIFIFATSNGNPRLIVFNLSSQLVVATASEKVVNGEWIMLTYFVDDTTKSGRVYMNGAMKGSGNFANRNRVLDQTNPYIVLNGRSYNPATGTVVDTFNGDTIAMGIVPNATAAMVAPLEADLRAIASAKGVTLP